MNQTTPENGFRLKKSEKLFIKLFVMLLRSIAWTSRTELENEGIIDEARRLHGGFILSTWHRNIQESIRVPGFSEPSKVLQKFRESG